jgi:hypothetical protein
MKIEQYYEKQVTKWERGRVKEGYKEDKYG